MSILKLFKRVWTFQYKTIEKEVNSNMYKMTKNRIQLLVSTMNQKNNEIIGKINVKSSAIIINQTDNFKYEEIKDKDEKIQFYNFNERGVGLSRNSALMRSDKDINILVDDDMVLYDNYEEIILNEIDKPRYRKFDIFIFNLEGKDKRFEGTKPLKVNWLNYMRFGAAGITFRRKKIIQNRIAFSLEFGGGTAIGSGEDTLFLKDCLKCKLKIIFIPIKIGKLDTQRESSWFNGYNDKYFKDKGKLFYTLSRRWAYFYAIRFALKFNSKKSFISSIKLIFAGIKERKNEIKN